MQTVVFGARRTVRSSPLPLQVSLTAAGSVSGSCSRARRAALPSSGRRHVVASRLASARPVAVQIVAPYLGSRQAP